MAPRRFMLTDRDVAILASLADVRYLMVRHLQWLHWPERWRAAERAARAAGESNHRPKKAYERVAAMVERGLLITLQRNGDRISTAYRRLPTCLSLTRAGAERLACERGLLMEQLWYAERATRVAMTLEHSLAIGTFYAALRAELEHRGRELQGWLADHLLCADYDSVAVASVPHPLPIIPDATFALEGVRYFVEVDRGSTRVEQWRKKALAYRAYQRDARLRARYGVDSFQVLVVVPSALRLQAIARVLVGVHADGAPHYRFLLEDRVHPFSIRRRWQRIGQVRQPPAGGGRATAGRTTITFSDAVLWAPSPEEQGA